MAVLFLTESLVIRLTNTYAFININVFLNNSSSRIPSAVSSSYSPCQATENVIFIEVGRPPNVSSFRARNNGPTSDIDRPKHWYVR